MTSEQKAVMECLPHVRRYARALLGNQESADALVLAALQAMALDRTPLRSAITRLEVFKRFTRTMHGPAGQHVLSLTPAKTMDSVVERRLAELSSQPREAFLLSAVEGFSNDQIAEILNIERSAVLNVLAKARHQILKQVSTRVLIIEDEMFIASHLADIVASLGHQVVAIERTHRDAVNAIAAIKPGLILADIQLADGSSGIDAVNEILHVCDVPAIFITAYPERLLTGLRPEPTFVLTKPFRDEAVRAVVSEALFFEVHSKSATPCPNHAEQVFA